MPGEIGQLQLRQMRDIQCHELNERLRQDFLKDFAIAGRSPSTIIAYGFACSDFLEFMCGVDVAKATHREVREWLHWQHSMGASSQTLSQRKYALGAFFKFLQRIDLITTSPVDHIQNRRVHRKPPRSLTIDEALRLVAACSTVRDKVIVEVLWATGARIAELCGMRIERVNWSERTIRILGKGNKERDVPLTPQSAAMLKQYVGNRTSGPIFLSHDIEQTGGLQLQRGQWWIGFYRETVKPPDGQSTRKMRSFCLGVRTKPKNRNAIALLLPDRDAARQELARRLQALQSANLEA
jgi:integrase